MIASKKSKRRTLLMVAGLLIPIAIISSYIQKNATTAAAVSACLPKEEKTKIASYENYELWIVGHAKHSRDLLIRLEDKDCVVINRIPGRNGDDLPLSSFIDSSIAFELNRQRFKAQIQASGGKEYYEGLLQRAVDMQGLIYMPSDTVEALKALDIEIPTEIQIADEPNWEDLQTAQREAAESSDHRHTHPSQEQKKYADP